MKNTFTRKIMIDILIIMGGLCCVIYILLSASGVIDREAAKAVMNSDSVITALEGEGTLETPFLIRNLNEFLFFAETVNSGTTYSGQYVNLLADIDLSSIPNGISIGVPDSENTFQGVFNGSGHQILNLNLTAPDGEAGLFLNLDGTVCNLTVAGGKIQGVLSGAIASSITDNAVIANCCNQSEVSGEVAGGIAGKNSGKIIDCVNYAANGTAVVAGDTSTGITEYCYNELNGTFVLYNNNRGDETPPEEARPMLQALNDRLFRLSNLYKTSDWKMWEMNNNLPVLSLQTADTLDSSSLSVEVDGQKRKIAGYYSETQDALCFAIPDGSTSPAWNMGLNFKQGTDLKLSVASGTTETSYAFGDIDYKIQFQINNTIPSVFVDTYAANGLEYLQEDKNHELNGNLLLLDASGTTAYSGALDTVSGRGNDSWEALKKGYSVRLKKPVDLLNMGENNDYVLLPGYRDNSLFSYKIVEDMAKEMQIAYAPESRLINLYINNEYLGMYLLAEKMEIDKNRFDLNDLYDQTKELNVNGIDTSSQEVWTSEETPATRIWYSIENEPDDCTGGYLLELDSKDYDEKQSRFISDHGISITLKSNVYASENQVNYVADFWQEFEDALYSDTGYNELGKYYGDYIDLESFADQWLMYELNEDTSMTGSVYFYKDSDEKGDGLLHAAYLWDVEHSFIQDEDVTRSWIMDRMADDLDETVDGYWLKLYQHEDFAELVYQEWINKFQPAIQKLLQTDEIENKDGVSSISWYERNYSYASIINSSRWSDCYWWDKGERIRNFITLRSEFLTTALSYYNLGYDYINEEDGAFYGYSYSADNSGEDTKELIEIQ